MSTHDSTTLHLYQPDCLEGITADDFPFKTTGKLKSRVRHAKDERNNSTPDRYVVVRDVDPKTAEDICNRSISLVDRSRLAYDAVSNVLIVRLVSRPHEEATQRMDLRITVAVSSMGLRDELHYFGASPVYAGGSGKQPDASYLPRTLPQGRTDTWPSIVIETGYSESSGKLRADAAWWLLASDGEVRLVIAVHISPQRPRIVTERWESVLADNSHGGSSRKPQLLQSSTIEYQNNLPVASGPLTIPFDRLFLRPPVPPQEHDLVYTPTELETLARIIWESQGFF
ncbi:hypothetical protein FQN53_006977 [Emmonsiellopsis sp. PD_33]|nr:hypothetical protein FQN53_006977 [Emmonsiellopsis sp. PD_33]